MPFTVSSITMVGRGVPMKLADSPPRESVNVRSSSLKLTTAFFAKSVKASFGLAP